MKTLVKENVSVYVFSDNETVDLQEEKTLVGLPVKLVIGDCNNTNTTLYENVTTPADWTGGKYFFNGTDWTLNPDWIDPATLED